jgi:hypothetical protein
MKILTTGNPARKTIAWAVLHKWPNAVAISRSSGYNLKLDDKKDREKFCELITHFDVFVNSSYIDQDVQIKLLDLTVEKWMEQNIKGHVFVIGTTAEWLADRSPTRYIESKIRLRNRCLDLNQQTGITGVKITYMILGGVNDGSPNTHDMVSPDSIVAAIEWVCSLSTRVALMQLDGPK